MQLTPREKDKLLLFTAALLAERGKARGLKLNYPEAVAYMPAAIIVGAQRRPTRRHVLLGTYLNLQNETNQHYPKIWHY